MKKNIRQQLCHIDVLILFASTLCLAAFCFLEITAKPSQRPILRLLTPIMICLSYYLGGVLFAKRTGSKKLLRSLFLLFFLLYLYLLLSLTLLDPSMGRGENSVYAQIEQTRAAYNARFVNLVPLRSIYHVYIKGFFGGYVNAYYTLLNLLGNLLALTPLAFFLPYFFPRQKRWCVFLPTALLTVILIEFLQYFFMIGSCDVDDLILNAGGAFLFFLILKLPFLEKMILKLT